MNAAKEHERNSKYQFWTHENHSEHIYTNKFIKQKLEYIHKNPVRAGIVKHQKNIIIQALVIMPVWNQLWKLKF